MTDGSEQGNDPTKDEEPHCSGKKLRPGEEVTARVQPEQWNPGP